MHADIDTHLLLDPRSMPVRLKQSSEVDFLLTANHNMDVLGSSHLMVRADQTR